MKIRYFASVRERLGMAEEDVEVPADIVDVAGWQRWMAGRGPDYAALFEPDGAIRVAVDHENADDDTPLAGAREMALFPPMTGG